MGCGDVGLPTLYSRCEASPYCADGATQTSVDRKNKRGFGAMAREVSA